MLLLRLVVSTSRPIEIEIENVLRVETYFWKPSRFSGRSRLTFFWRWDRESRSRPRRDKSRPPGLIKIYRTHFFCPQNREQRSERNVRDLERGVRSEVWTPETNLRIARVDPRALRRRVGPRKSRFGQLAKALSHPGKFITFEIIICKLLFDIFQMLYFPK